MRVFFASVLLALAPSGLVAQDPLTDSEKILDLVISARDDGLSDALMLMTYITGIFVAVALGLGFLIYKDMVRRIDENLRAKILESEVRNMLRLGYLYYNSYCEMYDYSEDGSLHSIINASSYTNRAVQMLNKLDESDSEVIDLKALSLTNLAYYVALRATDTRSQIERIKKENLSKNPGGNDNNPEKIKKLEGKLKKLRRDGLNFADASSLFVQSVERRREMKNVKWWDAVESRLFALYVCDDNFDAVVTRKKLDEIYDDSLVPQSWKEESRTEWEPRFKKSASSTPLSSENSTG